MCIHRWKVKLYRSSHLHSKKLCHKYIFSPYAYKQIVSHLEWKFWQVPIFFSYGGKSEKSKGKNQGWQSFEDPRSQMSSIERNLFHLKLFVRIGKSYSQTWDNNHLRIATTCLQRPPFCSPIWNFTNNNFFGVLTMVVVHRYDCTWTKLLLFFNLSGQFVLLISRSQL